MFTVKAIKRFGLSYFGIFHGATLLATSMSAIGATMQVDRLTRKLRNGVPR